MSSVSLYLKLTPLGRLILLLEFNQKWTGFDMSQHARTFPTIKCQGIVLKQFS